jgi:hypothetical protein
VRFKHHQSALGRYLEDRTAGFYHAWGCSILLLGAVMDYFIRGLWLPRAGAVVAGAAAYSYFFDPRTSDDWWSMRRKSAQVEIEAAKAELVLAGRTRGAVARARRLAEQVMLAEKLNAKARELQMSLPMAMRIMNEKHHKALQVQGFWVLVGTLIWAFGDIPVELAKCGAIPC